MNTVTVRLKKKKSEDGIFEVKDHVKIGQTYKVLLSTKMVRNGHNYVLNIDWEREIIFCVDDNGGSVGWMPVELLENLDGSPL